jgi:hypothetical protein
MENVFGAPNCSELDADEDFLTSQGITLTLFAAAAAAVGAALSKRKRAFSRGGSRPGKKSNRDIGRDDGAKRIDRDYFCRRSENSGLTPVFTEAEFERRYRIPRDVNERLREGLEWNGTKTTLPKGLTTAAKIVLPQTKSYGLQCGSLLTAFRRMLSRSTAVFQSLPIWNV